MRLAAGRCAEVIRLPELFEARLVRRYRRFLADVRLADGSELTVHCPNTGSMRGCQPPGARVWCSTSPNPRRRYAHTWELVELEGAARDGAALVGVNTARANALVREAIEARRFAAFDAWDRLRAEVRAAHARRATRFDFRLEDSSGREPPCWVEVKSVTLAVAGVGLFPDAVTERGRRHLAALAERVRGGERAALVFCVQHTGVERVAPADDLDPAYGDALRRALAAGVRVFAWGASIELAGAEARLALERELPVAPRGEAGPVAT